MNVCINGHLGLGDHLLCNGLVRDYATRYDEIIIPVWAHNKASVDYMFRDLGKVETHIVKDAQEAREIALDCDAHLDLGYNGEKFNETKFDQEFYRQGAVLFSHRWNLFHFERDQVQEAKCNVPFRFVHDDWGRGFQITRIKIDDANPIVRPHPLPNIFQFVWMLENADEIHCINSSFLILADSIPTKAKRLVFHKYARPTDHPTLKKDWETIS